MAFGIARASKSGALKTPSFSFGEIFIPLPPFWNPATPAHFRKPWIWVPAAVMAAVFFFLVTSFSRTPSSPVRYSIVLDAGSSGTRIHVYAFKSRRGVLLPEIDLGSTAVMRMSPGLSSFSDEPEKAGESLATLIEFGKKAVPRELWSVTEIRLMATAGLRMVEDELREMILGSCKRVLRDSSFQYRDEWVDVIPGSDEGIFAWVAANYALGTFGGDPKETTGIIALGGASAQVAFIASEPVPSELLHAVEFGDRVYHLYSQSFLHFGQNTALESLREMIGSRFLQTSAPIEGSYADPCAPKGYSYSLKSIKLSGDNLNSDVESQPVVYADGNFSECRSAAFKLLKKDKENCIYRECRLGSSFVPVLEGKFLATENFFYTSKFFGLNSSSFLSDLVFAGSRFCGGNFSEFKYHYQSLNLEELSQYCFSSAYIVALLHDSLGIGLEDERIGVANEVDGISIEWALGAFIMQFVSCEHRDVSPSVFLGAVAVVSVIGAVWLVLRWRRKPQLKTIYDLEKGRYYFITRARQ